MSKSIRLFSLLIASVPALAVWPAWYLESWKILIACLILAVPIMAIDAFTNKNIKSQFFHIAFVLSLYLPLVIYAFAKLYEKYGLIHNNEIIHSFSVSLYFSIVTWTTLGYGDYQPIENLHLWAASEALFGYIFMALLIASVMALLVKNKNV